MNLFIAQIHDVRGKLSAARLQIGALAFSVPEAFSVESYVKQDFRTQNLRITVEALGS